jgi:putative ABC transport system ATP-binding protein
MPSVSRDNAEVSLRLDKISKVYISGERRTVAVENVSLTINSGESCALVGRSGSGKTTVLGLAAALDQPTSGEIVLFGRRVAELDEDDRARLRNSHIGFIFQNFQLLPSLTALENVMVPSEINGQLESRGRARSLLESVGLANRQEHYPSQLSGGEQQRVALARAFINSPDLIIADEPTGNLDAENRKLVSDLLFELNASSGASLLLATHDQELATRCAKLLRMENGSIAGDGV